MTSIFKTLAILFFLFVQFANAQNSIIPKPVDFKSLSSEFILDSQVSFEFDKNNLELSKQVDLFNEYLKKKGIDIRSNSSNNPKKYIQVVLNKNTGKNLGNEGYYLVVNSNKIMLKANNPAGIFNGFQTLKQLVLIDAENKYNSKITGCEITDYPRFGWRGLMLDVSRHFFTIDEIKAYLDKMAEYKFNVFHWHLTDDQGWRIEIKSLPKLTEVGAWRVERYGRFGEGRPFPEEGEKATYGGFYTQEQIKEIVQYAADRNITIVPEIDMPGHSMAALAAYPELSVDKKPTFVMPGSKFVDWQSEGGFKMLIENTLNPADEEVYKFADKVFTEVAELFPGDYIHMGGDEAYHGYWEEDAGVQKFMKKHKIKDGKELQSYFVKRVEKIINSKGKKMIGWDEILYGGIAEDATVMSWRGMEGGIQAAKMGHDVIMTPNTYAYLDYTQGDVSVENKIYRSLSLEKTYEFEPVPEEVNPKYILGGQGNLWTEEVPTIPYAFYMTYPRAFAIAESLWSQKESKDWNDFVYRTQVHFDRFDDENINISKAVLEPIVKVYNEDGKLMCELKNSIPGTDIFYTIDNTYPVNFGNKYAAPFEIPQGNLDLRTQTYKNGKALGRELHISRKDLVKRVKK
ncbi:MAG: family 20 glycosylhydrolase [Bacteroidota bacterium]